MESQPPITGIFVSLKWRILSIAALSVFSLLAYLSVLFVETGKSASLLSDIQNKTYPVQEHMLAATHALEFINRELEIAAITGDEDSIASTLPLAETVRYELDKVAQIEIENKKEVSLLNAKFEDYYASAKLLATRMLDADSDLRALRSDGRITTAKYADLMQSASRFQSERKTDLKESIASTTAFASWMINFYLWTGLCAVAIVCYSATRTATLISSRIKEIVSILRKIAQDENDLSARISLTGRDEVTELGYWFNSFMGKLEVITTNSTNEILGIANTDFLSGLANRRSLLGSIENIIAEDTKRNTTFTLFFLDLDNFKPVNDELGHDAGDQLIQQVASRLHNLDLSGLEQDTPGIEKTHIAARLGGDEFVVLVTNLGSTLDAVKLADHMITIIADPYYLDAGNCSIGTSVGIAQYPKDAVSTSTLIECADVALYEAKGRGKNQHVLYSSDLASGSERQSKLEQGLVDGFSDNQFSLYFHPVFALTDIQDVVSADAILSWQNPEFGTIQQEELYQIAAQKNLMTTLDRRLFEQVCRQIEKWEKLDLKVIPITINLSARSLLQDKFINTLRSAVTEYQIIPDHVCIEITESLLLLQNEVLAETIDLLREMGLSVGVDDLGVGCASTNLLINNQVDRMSIDQSLVSNINSDLRTQAVITSMCSLAKRLNIVTAATGIENKEQYHFLKKAGCQLGRGYHILQPLTESEFNSTYMSTTPEYVRNSSHG